jgi:hypothetical protein
MARGFVYTTCSEAMSQLGQMRRLAFGRSLPIYPQRAHRIFGRQARFRSSTPQERNFEANYRSLSLRELDFDQTTNAPRLKPWKCGCVVAVNNTGVMFMALLTSSRDQSSEAKPFALRRKEAVEQHIAARWSET